MREADRMVYALLVGKFILPRSFGENPILPSGAINNETSADRNLSFRYAEQNSREWQNARKRILHTMQPPPPPFCATCRVNPLSRADDSGLNRHAVGAYSENGYNRPMRLRC